MSTENLPSEHLYMDGETAWRRVEALTTAIIKFSEESEQWSILHLARLSKDILLDQLESMENQALAEHLAAEDAAPVPSAPSPAPVLRVQAFELVDEAGKVRARLGFSAAGEPGLSLLNKRGDEIAAFCLDEGEPCLDFSVDGNMRMSLAIVDNNARLCLSDKNHFASLTLEMTADGTPSLIAEDAKSNELWRAPITAKEDKAND